jgi:hypothetical protein
MVKHFILIFEKLILALRCNTGKPTVQPLYSSNTCKKIKFLTMKNQLLSCLTIATLAVLFTSLREV